MENHMITGADFTGYTHIIYKITDVYVNDVAVELETYYNTIKLDAIDNADYVIEEHLRDVLCLEKSDELQFYYEEIDYIREWR